MLYSHSYHQARGLAAGATSFTAPETVPGLAAKTRGTRVGTFFTTSPALWMIEPPFSGLPSAIPWM